MVEPHFGGCGVFCGFRLLDEEGNSDAHPHLIVKHVAALFAALLTGGARIAFEIHVVNLREILRQMFPNAIA